MFVSPICPDSRFGVTGSRMSRCSRPCGIMRCCSIDSVSFIDLITITLDFDCQLTHQLYCSRSQERSCIVHSSRHLQQDSQIYSVGWPRCEISGTKEAMAASLGLLGPDYDPDLE